MSSSKFPTSMLAAYPGRKKGAGFIFISPSRPAAAMRLRTLLSAIVRPAAVSASFGSRGTISSRST